MKTRPLFIIILVILGTCAIAQQKPVHKHKYHVNEEGKLFWNKAEPVYLWASPTPDRPEHRLESKGQPEYTNPMYFDSEGLNYIRSRYAVDTATKEVIEPKLEIQFEVYSDGLAPKSKSSFNDSKYYYGQETRFYGPGLNVKIDAVDAVSGVENQFYSMNKTSYKKLVGPLSITKEGSYTLKYYAVDYVGNDEEEKEENFVLDVTPPFSDLNINGIAKNYIISTTSKMYLLVNDSLAGIKNTFYKLNDEEYKAYSGRNIKFAYLDDGEHNITYYSVDNVGNVEPERSFKFYLDKTAPLMVADVLGDRYIVGEKVYFSGRTKLKLTAVDNKVGVKETRYSIDGKEFETYQQPFYLPSISGEHIVRFYSVDNLGTQSAALEEETSADRESKSGYEEFKHNVSKVYVDLTGPALSNKFLGTYITRNDTVIIGPRNDVRLTASDPESGLQKITYSLDGELAETNYGDPFFVTNEGNHVLEYFGYDNVNNRNIKEVQFYVDATAPLIHLHLTHGSIGSRNNLPVYPAAVGVFLAATDARVGLKNIYYSLNGGAEIKYESVIKGLTPGKEAELSIRAIDILGNESKKTLKVFVNEQ